MAPPGEAFGFEAAPKDEKYDTEYLVRNMEHDRKRYMLIVVAVIVAAILGVITWISLAPEGTDLPPPRATPAAAPTEAAPAATDTATEDNAEGAASEANPGTE